MKSAEVTAGAEILSSIYLFLEGFVSFRPERLAAGSWACGVSLSIIPRSFLIRICEFLFVSPFRWFENMLSSPNHRRPGTPP